MKKERHFKYYEFKHLIIDCTVKKQKISNIVEKNNTESVIKRKKAVKKHRSSSADNTDDLKN